MAHEATDISTQLVAVKALFVRRIYELKKEINRLRVNTNNLYQEQQNSFLKWEVTLKQNTMARLLEISSSQYKAINYSKERCKKSIDIAKKDTGYELKGSDVLPTN